MNTKQLEIREVFAVTIFQLSGGSLDDWRSDPKVRQSARLEADAISNRLEERGVALRASSTKKMEEALETVKTIPAKSAYELEEVLQLEEAPKKDPPAPAPPRAT